ncbi:hypothetical protein ACWDGI_31300 [Streptomyces sp. NPDC001220]
MTAPTTPIALPGREEFCSEIGRVLWTAQDPTAAALVLYQRHQHAVAG